MSESKTEDKPISNWLDIGNTGINCCVTHPTQLRIRLPSIALRDPRQVERR